MKTILWGNYKGGVAKTTSAFQVATYFADMGKKVLLIDLDPQCSLSEICIKGAEKSKNLNEYKENETLNYIIELYIQYTLFTKDLTFSLLKGNKTTPIKDIIHSVVKNIKVQDHKTNNNLYFIPSSISFENCRLNDLAAKMLKNKINISLIQLLINDLQEKFDYIFIDCPPTSNILTQSAFLSSDYYIIPTIIDNISDKGVVDYILEIEKTKIKYIMDEDLGSILIKCIFGDEPKLIGVFETLYKERRRNSTNINDIVSLDNSLDLINKKPLIANEKYKKYRYEKNINGCETKAIFNYYIPHKDARVSGESIPKNTYNCTQSESYEKLATAILEIVEDN